VLNGLSALYAVRYHEVSGVEDELIKASMVVSAKLKGPALHDVLLDRIELGKGHPFDFCRKCLVFDGLPTIFIPGWMILTVAVGIVLPFAFAFVKTPPTRPESKVDS
jgi:hypothetical protein